MLKKVRPVVVDKVDDKPFDVGAILVLVSHYHQSSVPQGVHLRRLHVLFPILKAKDLHNVFDLIISHDLEEE